MRIMDKRFTKEQRRGHLALEFLRGHVRTKTICVWTGLSRARVDKLRKAHVHEFPDEPLVRPSGQAPETLCELLRKPMMRSEAAALGGLCRAFGVIPQLPVPDARRYLPSLFRGEQVCAIHDLFRKLVPFAKMKLEELISFLLALASGENHDVGRCIRCGAVVLVDPLGVRRKICIHCTQDKAGVRVKRIRRPRAPPA